MGHESEQLVVEAKRPGVNLKDVVGAWEALTTIGRSEGVPFITSIEDATRNGQCVTYGGVCSRNSRLSKHGYRGVTGLH